MALRYFLLLYEPLHLLVGFFVVKDLGEALDNHLFVALALGRQNSLLSENSLAPFLPETH